MSPRDLVNEGENKICLKAKEIIKISDFFSLSDEKYIYSTKNLLLKNVFYLRQLRKMFNVCLVFIGKIKVMGKKKSYLFFYSCERFYQHKIVKNICYKTTCKGLLTIFC